MKCTKQHGEFALTMVNDIVLVNAVGPWNTECVDNFGLTYAGAVYSSGFQRWADIVYLRGESLLVPEAETALTQRIGRAVAGGLVQVYIVTERSFTAVTSKRQISKLYEPYSVSVAFVDELDHVFSLAEAAGFDVDRHKINAFFA